VMYSKCMGGLSKVMYSVWEGLAKGCTVYGRD